MHITSLSTAVCYGLCAAALLWLKCWFIGQPTEGEVRYSLSKAIHQAKMLIRKQVAVCGTNVIAFSVLRARELAPILGQLALDIGMDLAECAFAL